MNFKIKIMQMLNKIFGAAESCGDSITDEAYIIDVRSPGEFDRGNVPGSVNIPLETIGNHINDLKHKNQPIILCCASGARSGRATQLLKSHGISACNGGSWITVNYAKLN